MASIGLTLFLFTLIFSVSFDSRASVQDLEDHHMIDSMNQLHPAIVLINTYMLQIIVCILGLPPLVFGASKMKKLSDDQQNDLTEPLLE